MQHIDEKFKDNTPAATVEQIRAIIRELGIEVEEKWHDSGLEHCYSLSVQGPGGVPNTNGKGVTRDLARASAYGEFIERLQGGLLTIKYQSIKRNPSMDIHGYAPDAKYMTVEELIAEGDWMDHIIRAYRNPMITRESIGEYCRAYACADDDKLLTVPYYSLFEDKYVYLPVGFVDQMYTNNGCCAGNTREEAWVHALSEIMERNCNIRIIQSGEPAPRIPEETLKQFKTVWSILTQLREDGEFEIDFFDYSFGTGFPVIAVRLISRKTHSYLVNVGADPVLEIAIQRTLTELFQGKSKKTVAWQHDGRILSKITDVPLINNVINQLEVSRGYYTADFFVDELTCTTESAGFDDNSGKNNKQLLTYMLELYKKLGKQVYVRNLSYLGFPSYKFVVPGFSETRGVQLSELVPAYAIADEVAKTLRNPAQATDEDLNWMLIQCKMIDGIFSRSRYYSRMAGVPISGIENTMLCWLTRAYGSYRLKQYGEAIKFLAHCCDMQSIPEADREYFRCINRYLTLIKQGIEPEKVRLILYKFYEKVHADRLYSLLEQGKTPYDPYLFSCDYKSCDTCRRQSICAYQKLEEVYRRAGMRYQQFTHGQDRSEFAI